MKCPEKLRKTRTFAIRILIALALGLAFMMGGFVRDSGRDADRLIAQAGFEWIEFALLRYHKDHGRFPPPRYQTAPDHPIHSWRVLMTEYMGPADRFAKYDFSKAWDSVENLETMGWDSPKSYRIGGRNGGASQYLSIGEGGKWPSDKPLSSYMVTAGDDQFLLIVDPESNTHWMSPEN
jgi:hypothetical protein